MRNLQPIIDRHLDDLTALRHDLHRWPELAYQEERTSERVVRELEDLPGMTIRTGVGGTGVVAVLGAEKTGPCVGLRADMDALPIDEETGAEYASERPGLMHACGHDGHTTCLIGAARVLAELAEELAGPVKFVFQPAEEGGGGADRMIKDGALLDPAPRAMFGLHGWPTLPRDLIGSRSGPLMASNAGVRIIIRGRDGHAAMPHQAVDPVLVGAHIITALQSVASRATDPLDSIVISMTQFKAGTAGNVIPGRAELYGTLRALKGSTRDAARQQIESLATHTATAFGASAEVSFDDFYPVTLNHESAVDYLREVTEAAMPLRPDGSSPFQETAPTMAAEDFAFYGYHIPTAFWFLGLAPEGQESYPRLHQPNFDFPDEVIPTGVLMHCELARRFARNFSCHLPAE